MTWSNEALENVIATLESGSRPTGGASIDGGEVLSIGGENILQSGGVTLEDVKRVPVAFYNRMTKGHLRDDDVLMNKDGAQTGKVGWYHPGRALVACINEHVFLLRGDPDQITQGYLYYSLLSDLGQVQIRLQISGSAQPGLKTGFTKGVNVDIPADLREQSMIVRVLSTVDRAIEETEALIAKQQRIKTGLMQDLLTRGIDELGNIRSEKTHDFKDSRLGRIPIEWEVRSMSELTTQIVDGVHHTPTYISSGVPFIVVSDLTSGIGIDFNHTRFVSEAAHTEYAKRVEPRSGDVLVSKDGTLGVARIVPVGAPRFSIFVSVALLRPKHRLCIADLLWSFFESGEFYRQLGALSAGTGLAHIHLEHFRKFQLRCPCVDEQGKIFAVITAQSRLLTEYTDALQKLRSVRTALTQDLLTGKRRVTPLLEQCEEVPT